MNVFDWARRIWKLIELGFTRQTYINLFTDGVISYKEMEEKLDELDEDKC